MEGTFRILFFEAFCSSPSLMKAKYYEDYWGQRLGISEKPPDPELRVDLGLPQLTTANKDLLAFSYSKNDASGSASFSSRRKPMETETTKHIEENSHEDVVGSSSSSSVSVRQ